MFDEKENDSAGIGQHTTNTEKEDERGGSMIVMYLRRVSVALIVFVCIGWKAASSSAVADPPDQESNNVESQIIPFDETHWQPFGGQFVEHMGRSCLKGTAQLKDAIFGNGVIEFDVAITGARSYPGLRFRAQSPAAAENVYIRPHRVGLYPDALQYTPIFNREACWQLYNGEGFTNSLQMETEAWVRFRLEVSGSQARVFVGDSQEPALKIDDLKHGESRGGIILTAPPDGSAHFSNFRVDTTARLRFEPPLKQTTPPGMLTDWEISQNYKYTAIDLEKTPGDQGLNDIEWRAVGCEPSGLVNISRHIQRRGREPDFIFARTTIEAEKEKQMELNIGYSDYVVIFLNGEMLFSGSSPYQGRDPSFLGIIGLFDTVILPLKKGPNTLMLLVGETFGGWGFMCQDGDAVFQDASVTKLWESEKRFQTSESVLYDPKREVLYVTNFDQFNVGNPAVRQSISRVSLDGRIEELEWVGGLNNPLGMTIHKDRLYVAERNGVAVIDPEKAEVVRRIPVPGSLFLNDIAVDREGRIYITDSRKNVIWRVAEDEAEPWLTGSDVEDPNVIYCYQKQVLFGNSADGRLKTVDPQSKAVRTVARLDRGFIDGFRVDHNGDYLVSLWRGILYRVKPSGQVTRLLDTTTPGIFSADFEYIPEKRMLIIPNFYGNTITAYSLK